MTPHFQIPHFQITNSAISQLIPLYLATVTTWLVPWLCMCHPDQWTHQQENFNPPVGHSASWKAGLPVRLPWSQIRLLADPLPRISVMVTIVSGYGLASYQIRCICTVWTTFTHAPMVHCSMAVACVPPAPPSEKGKRGTFELPWWDSRMLKRC